MKTLVKLIGFVLVVAGILVITSNGFAGAGLIVFGTACAII